jgi:hypothetical protein
MKPPVVLWSRDDGTAKVFDSAERLLLEVESPDVDDANYSAFDSEGRLLNLRVDRKGAAPKRRRWFQVFVLEPVILEEAETEPTHQDELRELLIRNLGYLGIDRSKVEPLSLQELLAHPMFASIR